MESQTLKNVAHRLRELVMLECASHRERYQPFLQGDIERESRMFHMARNRRHEPVLYSG